MARTARSEVFDPLEVAVAHVIQRCVRRCFLMGNDPESGKNYDDRKQWLEDRLQCFAACFGIDLLCFYQEKGSGYFIGSPLRALVSRLRAATNKSPGREFLAPRSAQMDRSAASEPVVSAVVSPDVASENQITSPDSVMFVRSEGMDAKISFALSWVRISPTNSA